MKGKVLIADDEALSRELIRVALEKCDYEVIEAGDGQDALNVIRNEQPDLVLLDIQLLRLDGYAVIQHVRSDPRLRALCVVAFTAQAMSGESEKALAAGFDGYLAKPVDIVLLRETISELLQ